MFKKIVSDKNDIKKMNSDAMFKLEHGEDDKAKLKAKVAGLSELEAKQSRWKDDDLLNAQARNVFRVWRHYKLLFENCGVIWTNMRYMYILQTTKKSLKEECEQDLALLKKSSLDIALVKEHDDDKRMASLLKFSALKSKLIHPLLKIIEVGTS